MGGRHSLQRCGTGTRRREFLQGTTAVAFGPRSACTEIRLAHEPEHKTETTGTRARQGRQGFPILMVLIVGLVLAMGAWGVAEMYGVWIAPDDPIGDASNTID